MPEVWLDRLIEAEQVDRQARSLNYQLKAARFPIHPDLMTFEWQDKSVGNGFEQRLRWPWQRQGAYQDDTHSHRYNVRGSNNWRPLTLWIKPTT